MTRRIHRLLIALHPRTFRRRFEDEILCIFDEAGAAAERRLTADALVSLFRQWLLRSRFPVVSSALFSAGVLMVLGALTSLAAMHRMIAANLVLWSATPTPQETGAFLLLIAGSVTAILLAATAIATWCIRSCARRAGRTPLSLLFVLAATGIVSSQAMRGQSPVERPRFDVASIRLNTTGCANGRGGRGGGPSPGRLRATCITVRDLIQAAYGTFANDGNRNRTTLELLDAPGWVGSDSYDIEAKPAGDATVDQMYGPMLQVLLEDRFHLKIHRETRELPVYTLTVAGNGPKLPATKAGACTVLDPSHPPAQAAPQAPVRFCGSTSIKRTGAMLTVDAIGMSMALFAGTTLPARLDLDRPVIDKTGIQGLFDFHLELAAGDTDAAPSIFTALQEQLGLKLSPDKGPVDVLVLDRIEKPTAN